MPQKDDEESKIDSLFVLDETVSSPAAAKLSGTCLWRFESVHIRVVHVCVCVFAREEWQTD